MFLSQFDRQWTQNNEALKLQLKGVFIYISIFFIIKSLLKSLFGKKCVYVI